MIGESRQRSLRRIVQWIGPGFVTGASDDDPSGIGTYAVAGASFGFDHASQLPVHNPKHGEPIKPGHIYVAKPNHHLLVLPGHVELGTGPRENGFRPAADPLFRTAALSYG